jgi:uncharacterized SAM-binding protein YcdF (DUF218 family)
MNYLLFILLGSHVTELLNGRVKAALDFAANITDQNNTHIDWFLSGGVKNVGVNGGVKNGNAGVSEAEKMAYLIGNKSCGVEWDFILDKSATNTAENLIAVSEMGGLDKYSGVYVITSEFHFNRAKMITDLLLEDNRFGWILSDIALADSYYWESVHIKNVRSDVAKAKQRMLRKM